MKKIIVAALVVGAGLLGTGYGHGAVVGMPKPMSELGGTKIDDIKFYEAKKRAIQKMKGAKEIDLCSTQVLIFKDYGKSSIFKIIAVENNKKQYKVAVLSGYRGFVRRGDALRDCRVGKGDAPAIHFENETGREMKVFVGKSLDKLESFTVSPGGAKVVPMYSSKARIRADVDGLKIVYVGRSFPRPVGVDASKVSEKATSVVTDQKAQPAPAHHKKKKKNILQDALDAISDTWLAF